MNRKIRFPIMTGYSKNNIGKTYILIERSWNHTIADMITVSEQPHMTSSLSVFVNAKPVQSCFENVSDKLSSWGIIGVQTQLNKSI